MSAPRHKYYVVWEGREPGIYTSWEACREQVENWPEAKYKAFANVHEATAAFRGSPFCQLEMMRSIIEAAGEEWSADGTLPGMPSKASDRPTVGVAVDGACAGNPGVMEYRAVDLASGQEIFHRGADGSLIGTNNIAEYLALVHICAELVRRGDTSTPVYSDSRTALIWYKRHHSKSTLARNERTAPVLELLARADAWMGSHTVPNPVIKWNTERWGEIPADFGRK